MADANADVDAISDAIASAANEAAAKVGAVEKEAAVFFSEGHRLRFHRQRHRVDGLRRRLYAAKDAIVRAIAPLTRGL